MEPSEDQIALARTLDGSQDAFEALFDRYFQRVFGFARRRGAGAEQAAALTEEVLGRLFGSPAALAGLQEPGALARHALSLTRRALADRGLARPLRKAEPAPKRHRAQPA